MPFIENYPPYGASRHSAEYREYENYRIEKNETLKTSFGAERTKCLMAVPYCQKLLAIYRDMLDPPPSFSQTADESLADALRTPLYTARLEFAIKALEANAHALGTVIATDLLNRPWPYGVDENIWGSARVDMRKTIESVKDFERELRAVSSGYTL